MSKDYKDRPAKRSGGGGVPGVIWLIGGFALGIAVATLYQLGKPASPAPKGSAAGPKASVPATAPATGYTFHDILGNLEVAVPGRIKSEQQAADPSRPPAIYALQVGAFRTEPEADRMRAELALLGFEAKIQKATIDDKDTWYRVRLGPFKDAAELQSTLDRLAENDIKSVPVRKGP